MSAYIFKGIELLSLMGLTGFLPENNSPVWKVISNLKKPEQEETDLALSELLKIGMIASGDDGKLHPVKESGMVMKILCNPSQVTGIRRMGISGDTEYCLLKLGSLYCLYLAVPEQDLHICQFPLDEELVKSWFEIDILDGLPQGLADGSKSSCSMSPVEGILLNCIQEWYGKKVKEKIPLDEEDMWFPANMILKETDVEKVTQKLTVIYSSERIQNFVKILADVQIVEKRLRSMVESGLLIARYSKGVEYFSYSSFLMMFMDPVLLRDILMIEKYSPQQKVTVVYLKTNGIFLVNNSENAVTFESTDVEGLKQLIV